MTSLITLLPSLFRQLHAHPELSLEEHETAALIRSTLREAGIRLLDSPMPTGVIAMIGSGSPVIGLRADMDALPVTEESGLPYASTIPGKMHACGHDFHIVTMLGTALLLKLREKELPGAVKIVFQPAEEIDRGGAIMAEAPVLSDVQCWYASHSYHAFPAGEIGVKEGPVMAAIDRFSVTLRGTGAHAGQPHKGVDPIPAMAALIQGAQSIMSRTVDPFADAVLSITHAEAGTTWNIVPETAFLEGTVRTLDSAVREAIETRFRRMAAQTADAYGVHADIHWEHGSPAVVNDAALCRLAREVALAQGLTVRRQEDTLGGEDFSRYLAHAPGVFIRVGTGGLHPNHHPAFTADPSALLPAAQYFAALAEASMALAFPL